MRNQSPQAKGAAIGLLPRRLAAETLAKTLDGQSFHPLGPDAIDDPRDRAFANRLVTIALRRNGHLDLIVQQLLARGLPKRAGHFEAILRIGLAELLFLPGAAPHAAINSAVDLIKTDRRGSHLHRLMNGTLREAQRRADAFMNLPAEALLPEFFRARWRNVYGQVAIEGFATALITGAPLDLTLKSPDPDLPATLGASVLSPLTMRLETRDSPIDQMPGYAAGKWWVQDMAAAIPARLIELPKGARVLDLCAAPGGKTAQLAAAGYQVTALDNNQHRLGQLAENLARLGLSAEFICADATEPLDLEPFAAILIDAPCSATGTFRRHPEVLLNRSADDISSRAALQRRIVAQALSVLQPDGILIYATCSLEPEEGEEQANWIATTFPQLSPLPVTPELVYGNAEFISPEGWVRTHPGQRASHVDAGALDGFFVARYKASL